MWPLIKRYLLLSSIWEYGLLIFLLLLFQFIAFSPYLIFLFSVFSLYGFLIYDHYYHVNRLFRSMPIKVSKLVKSQYFFLLLFPILFIAIQIIFMKVISMTIISHLYYTYTWQDIIIALCLGGIIIAIITPVIYVFKSLVNAIFFIIFLPSIFLGVIFGRLVINADYEFNDIFQFVKDDTNYHLFIEHLLPGNAYISFIFITAILIVCSYFISVWICKRKDLA